MKISDSVRALLTMCGMKRTDLLKPLGIKSAASLNNKFSYDRWDGKDLIRVADATDCRIGFLLKNGDWLMLDNHQYPIEEHKNAE